MAFAVRSRVLLGLRCVVQPRRTAGPFSFSDWSHLLVISLIYGRRGRCLKAEDARVDLVGGDPEWQAWPIPKPKDGLKIELRAL